MRYVVGFVLFLLALGCGGDEGGFPCTEQGIRDAIAEGGGPHTFACDGPTTVVTEAEIVIDNDVILDGEGNLTLDAWARRGHRVLSVPEGVTAELRGLTVTGGYADLGCGAGIANRGTLSIGESVVSKNSYDYGGGGCFGSGGVYNEGEMTIINSTISKNNATHGTGGGIRNECSATLTLVNSTVSGNSAAVDGWMVPIGAGIDNHGTLTIVNSTISENTAHAFDDAYGGGIASSGWISVINSTISGNTAGEATAIALYSNAPCSNRGAYLQAAGTLIGGDCGSYGEEGSQAAWVSKGYNIESPGDTCGFDQPTDQVNVSADDLKLEALADNGGPTETHALGDGSVAIDVIPADMCEVDEDQRGFPRDSMCEVGAFEVQQ
jgi:hypothetical protein